MTTTREGSLEIGEESSPQPVSRDVRSRTPNIIILDRKSADRLSLSPHRDTRREKSPFEIGRRKDIVIASQKAVIDKAAIMDITGVTSRVAKSVDEFIQFYVNDYGIIDKASCFDISPSSVKIVIIEEDEEEENANIDEVIECENEEKKKLRWKKRKMDKKHQAMKKAVMTMMKTMIMMMVNRKQLIVKRVRTMPRPMRQQLLSRRKNR